MFDGNLGCSVIQRFLQLAPKYKVRVAARERSKRRASECGRPQFLSDLGSYLVCCWLGHVETVGMKTSYGIGSELQNQGAEWRPYEDDANLRIKLFKMQSRRLSEVSEIYLGRGFLPGLPKHSWLIPSRCMAAWCSTCSGWGANGKQADESFGEPASFHLLLGNSK